MVACDQRSVLHPWRGIWLTFSNPLSRYRTSSFAQLSTR